MRFREGTLLKVRVFKKPLKNVCFLPTFQIQVSQSDCWDGKFWCHQNRTSHAHALCSWYFDDVTLSCRLKYLKAGLNFFQAEYEFECWWEWRLEYLLERFLKSPTFSHECNKYILPHINPYTKPPIKDYTAIKKPII